MKQLEWLATILSLAAAAGYFTGGVLFLKEKRNAAAGCLAFGWICNLAIFIKNIAINGYAPFASMYQVLSVLSLCFLPIGLFLTHGKEREQWLWPYFSIPAALPLIGTIFMDKQLKWALVPALQSAWFVPHVLSYMLSYSLAAVAFVLTVVSLLRKAKGKAGGELGGKPGGGSEGKQAEHTALTSGLSHAAQRSRAKADSHKIEGTGDRYDGAAYRILLIAFPFMTTGLCFGALWADQVWGNFWQWDVKEIWSLITALCYLCYFHQRRLPGGKRTAVIWSLLGFAALIVTFLCVNLLPSVEESFHLYA